MSTNIRTGRYADVRPVTAARPANPRRNGITTLPASYVHFIQTAHKQVQTLLYSPSIGRIAINISLKTATRLRTKITQTPPPSDCGLMSVRRRQSSLQRPSQKIITRIHQKYDLSGAGRRRHSPEARLRSGGGPRQTNRHRRAADAATPPARPTTPAHPQKRQRHQARQRERATSIACPPITDF